MTASGPQSIIGEIMQRHGATCAFDQFHAAVNVAFHTFESEIYDQIHACMWESLPRQFSLLVDDWLAADPRPAREVRMLDIGCGTGLASDSMLKTAIGPGIRSLDLLDTSSAMLRRIAQRASGWGRPFTCLEGVADSVAPGNRYDVIVTCSVLHHIPDIAGFLQSVRSLQAHGGVFIHLQDPNGDFLADPELQRRMAEEQDPPSPLPEWLRRLSPRRILGRVRRELTGRQGQDYLSKTNRVLLEKRIIATPLSATELFSITDIHVNNGQGIPVSRMKEWMPGYACLSARSYAFWGKLESELPPALRESEQRLIAARASNGLQIGACWKLRS